MESMSALPIQGVSQTEDIEASLIAAAQINIACFESLYQQYMPRVYRYLRTRVGNDEEAADLTQQVFLKALDALPNYRIRGIPFAAWLFRIARHSMTDNYRRHNKSGISWDTLPDMIEAVVEQNPETILLRREQFARLRTLLSNLDPHKRELLSLRFAAGLSTSEIAVIVGKSQDAVKKQLTRTLHILREQYQYE